jgi:hypothetical protein
MLEIWVFVVTMTFSDGRKPSVYVDFTKAAATQSYQACDSIMPVYLNNVRGALYGKIASDAIKVTAQCAQVIMDGDSSPKKSKRDKAA